MRKRNSILMLIVAANLAACGGGGGNATNTALQSAEGIWVGSTTSSSGYVTPSVGLVLDTGEYFFGTGTDYSGVTFGTVAVSGSTVTSSNMKDYDPQLNTLINGSFTGTVTSGSTMSVNISETYNGITYTSVGSFTFDPKYNEPSSLATIAGRYANQNAFSGAYNYTVDANGVLSGTTTLCVLSGQLSLRNGTKNVYNLTLTTSNATAAQGCPAGQQTLRGVATYAVMPNRTARSLVLIALTSTGNYFNRMALAGERQ